MARPSNPPGASSTGPRTAAGKARSSRNAFKTGLSQPAYDLPLSAQYEAFAQALADGDPRLVEAARNVASRRCEYDRQRRGRCAQLALEIEGLALEWEGDLEGLGAIALSRTGKGALPLDYLRKARSALDRASREFVELQAQLAVLDKRTGP